ncbi:MAG: response regulator [Alphaproteobacteria bacterium]|nr:response regulator [Alphaproteobacteria bacterium]OJV13595.1 MAG: two-component system response regulator [Alphaproteobacteria bacterium 33-17]
MKKILIVEDNVLNLKLFVDVLKANNFEVIPTSDGFQAVNLVEENMPDIILMDIQLQGITGIDIIKQIKSVDKFRHIPIIAITAFAAANDEAKIRDSGCNDFMAKPFSITDLVKKIQQTLEVS